MEDADLRKLGSIVVDMASPGERWVDAGFTRAKVPLSASASTTLAPQGRYSFEPSNAIDGDAGTAWCEGAPGKGEGSTLDVRWTVTDAGQECRVRDVVLVPGYARDEKAFTRNGRVRSLRLEDCDHPSDGFEVDLYSKATEEARVLYPRRPVERFDAPPIEIHVPNASLRQATCVRLRILAVNAGEKYEDTCISEFVPRVFCRSREAK
jgi:hypothetical protein